MNFREAYNLSTFTSENLTNTERPNVAEIFEAKQNSPLSIFLLTLYYSSNLFYILIILTCWKNWQKETVGTKLQCWYLAVLFIKNVLGLFIFLFTERLKKSSTFCATAAILFHFTLFVAYLWVSCMTFHICQRFCYPTLGIGLNPRNSISSSYFKVEKPIRLSALFSCGGSFCLTSFAVAMDMIYRDSINKAPFSPPRFGEKRCTFFTTEEAALIYFFGPVTVFSLINLLMLTLTIRAIRKGQRKPSVMVNLQQNEIQAKRWKLFLRLFFVAELIWALDTVRWAYFAYIYNRNFTVDIIVHIILYPLRLVYSLNGLFLFYIIVWSNSTKRNRFKTIFMLN